MELKIQVDRNRCIGSGQCVHTAPGVFDQDDEAISVVVDSRGEPEEKIVTAVLSCPVQAISLSLDGSRVEAQHLRLWHHGPQPDDPLTPRLEQLCDDHDRLRASLGGLAESSSIATEGGPLVELANLLRDHLLREDREVYPVISALVGSSLVEVFDRDHAMIINTLEELDGAERIPTGAVRELAEAVEDHIRLEEAVLFRVALGVLAGGPAPAATPL